VGEDRGPHDRCSVTLLAGTSVAAGVVPDDTVAGYPAVNTFGGSAVGYLSRVEFASSVAGRLTLYDRLFVAGAYAFNASQALSAQPSFSARLPGTSYKGLEIWVEQVTAGTLVQNVAVTYDDDGDISRTTGTVAAPAAMVVGRCFQLPLVAGGNSVKKITNVVGSTASAGTFNVMVLRPLWTGRMAIANDADVHDLLRTGMPIVYDTSALFMLAALDSTALGVPDCMIEIVNG